MNKLYIRLAKTNFLNNKQFYFPYMFTGMIMVAMYYIMVSLENNSGLKLVRGASHMGTILGIGTWVIGIFGVIVLFYTNGFIMRRRKKELGIYNILGMEKRHIGKVIFWECGFVTVVAIAGGFILGILFSKFMIMMLYYLMNVAESIVFEISVKAILQGTILFGLIYIGIFLYDLFQIKIANPVELLSGGSVGEKEPKSKWLLSIVGIGAIGAGYYIAISEENPLKAMYMFFVAVILVIIGTYCLFTAVSVTVLKLLRKHKNFYYNKKNFVAVSGMLYRMKQNAVSLSNICILSTMVLVVVAGTVSMYLGIKDQLNFRYPYDVSLSFSTDHVVEDYSKVEKQVEDILKKENVSYEIKSNSGSFGVLMHIEEDGFSYGDIYTMDTDQYAFFTVYTREGFEKAGFSKDYDLGELKKGEVAVLSDTAYDKSTIKLGNNTWNVAYSKELEKEDADYMRIVGACYYIVVEDYGTLNEIFAEQKEGYGENASDYDYYIGIDFQAEDEEIVKCAKALYGVDISGIDPLSAEGTSLGIECRQEGKDDFYAINAGLLFIGIFLGSLFLIVTVLIIFYKQISEGYDDRNRYHILSKVGMSHREIQVSIGSQIRMVFFLPLLTAAVHLFAAYPMLKRVLMLLNLNNATLFFWCFLGTLCAFGVIYYVVFKLTSKTYVKIVG